MMKKQGLGRFFFDLLTGSLVILSLFLVSCASKPVVDTSRRSTAGPTVSGELSQDYAVGGGEGYVSKHGTIAGADNKYVKKWLKYFQGKGRRHMNRYLKRSSRYLPMMKGVLREHGLPQELVYVALIESGFNSVAHSHAGAVGYWQFIRGTGRRYGLKISSYVDERRDPVLATHAAAEYFKALYNLFGDWHLALASYNTGENRVKRAVMRYNTRDYWHLIGRRKLPRETRNYVPKFIAAMQIAQNPEQYGFTDLNYKQPLKYDSVDVTKPVSLLKLAKKLSMPFKSLQKLNPRYRTDYVPIYRGTSSQVRVPRGYMNAAYSAIEASRAAAPSYIAKEHFYYRIRRGDTLSGIAQRHRTRVSTLRRLNNMGRRSFLRVGKKIKVPERGVRTVRYQAKAPSQSVKRARAKGVAGYSYYRIRRGDTLSQIAERHRVSLSKLRRVNGFSRRSMIRVGQRIKIPQHTTGSPAGSPTAGGNNSSHTEFHKVKSGENLTLIARKYGLSVNQLRKMNRLSRKSVLQPGKKLRVGGKSKVASKKRAKVAKISPKKRRSSKKSSRVHVVRRGDTLSDISEKYNVPLSRITKANALKGRSKILVGMRLKIPQ